MKYLLKQEFKTDSAEEGETALDLAIVACNKLLSSEKIDKDKIDGLILCTQSPDYIMPPNSSVIHGILGLKENVFAYDFVNLETVMFMV